MATYTDILDLINDNLASGSKIPAVDHREVEIALLDYIQANIAQSGDIKRVKCDLTYLNDNFESDGLGKNLRLGWAICNGNNGTDNLAGRVGVAYGIGWSTLGFEGGSKDSVVVSHSHSSLIPVQNISSGSTGNNIQGTGQTQLGGNYNLGTSTVGVSGIDKNMQPYIINLYIMKL